MKVFVLGATGATGKRVVAELLHRDCMVRVLIREHAALPGETAQNNNLETIRGNINEKSPTELAELIGDCDAVVSCLGHNISFKGLFGKPRKLVFDAVKAVASVIEAGGKDTKFILMSTTAYSLKSESQTFAAKLVFTLLKLLLPPHKDNMLAGDYITRNCNNINWIAVRPDSLVESDSVSAYEIVPNLLRNPITNPGETSRINAAHFMVELLSNDTLWNEWKRKTPVIYNK